MPLLSPICRSRVGDSLRRDGFALFCVVAIGIFAKNGWLPSTDPLTGQRTGWFWARSCQRMRQAVGTRFRLYPDAHTDAVDSRKNMSMPARDCLRSRTRTPLPCRLRTLRFAFPSISDVVCKKAGRIRPQTTFTSGRAGRYSYRRVITMATARPTFAFTGLKRLLGCDIQLSACARPSRCDRRRHLGDVPAQADFDGDGRTDAAVFRPSTGTWHIHNSSTDNIVTASLGTDGRQSRPRGL